MDKASKVGLFLLCLFLFARSGEALQNYEMGNLRFQSFPTHTQIILEKATETGYVTRELKNPPRLLVNLFPAVFVISDEGVKVGEEWKVEVGDNFVQKIRLKQEHEYVVKLVLDLALTEYTYNVSSEDSQGLVIDIRGPRKDSGKDLVAELLRKIESTPSPPSSFTKKKGKIIKIVLDPGHGGEDPGAIGPSGLKEKDVVLAVAKELASLLEKEPGIKVYLTRDKDSFLALYRRTEIANQIGGDIFISIHANAAFSRKATGVETFVNSSYAEGKGAELVAARENAPVGGSKSVSREVKAILWDMIQDKYRSGSNDLAHFVQKRLVETTGLEDRTVKKATFYVLRGAAMPAILVEIGFISNPWEESKLKKEDFRKKVARGILEGLKDYLKKIKLRT